MPTKDDITRLRQTTSDEVIYNYMLKQDPAFKDAVDRVQPGLQQASPLVRLRFPTAIINRHYLGSWELKKSEPMTAQMATSAAESAEIASQPERGLLDPYTVESQMGGGLSAVAAGGANILKSGARFARDVGTAAVNVFNPDLQKNTVANLGRLAVGGAANTLETITGNEQLFDAPGEDLASSVGQFYKQRYGSPEGILKTLYEDPVGFLSDLATVAGLGGAAIKGVGTVGKVGTAAATAGKTSVPLASTAAKVGKASSKVAGFGDDLMRAGVQAEPIVIAGKGALKAVKGAGNAARYGVGQLTGLSPETIKFITDNGDTFTQAQKGTITRSTVAEKVQKGTQGLLDDLSDTGKGYETIRKSGQTAKVSASFFDDFLKKTGVKAEVGDDGLRVRLSTDLDTKIPITKAELSELEDLINLVRGRESFTADQVLNLRQRLTQMSKFDAAKSDAFRTLAKQMRSELNTAARPQIKGLEALDTQYRPLVEEATKLKKEFIDVGADGQAVLKDTALSKIANLTKKGSEAKLARIEKLVPEIADEVRAIKALEDVQYANGQKVGTYLRGTVGGAGLVTGNVPAVIVSILSTPSLAVPIIKAYGKLKHLPAKVVEAIVQKISKGEKLTDEQGVIVSNAMEHFDEDNIPLSQVSAAQKAEQAYAVANPGVTDGGATAAKAATSLKK